MLVSIQLLMTLQIISVRWLQITIQILLIFQTIISILVSICIEISFSFILISPAQLLFFYFCVGNSFRRAAEIYKALSCFFFRPVTFFLTMIHQYFWCPIFSGNLRTHFNKIFCMQIISCPVMPKWRGWLWMQKSILLLTICFGDSGE